MKVVIIEDEKLTAKDLAKMLTKLENSLEIVAILQSVEEAVAFFTNETKIDLIFSDIELGDGLSFEIFKQVELSIPIIFCTAYDHYALQAFNTLGLDYLLKPVSNNALLNSLEKFDKLKGDYNKKASEVGELIKLLKNSESNKPSSVIVYFGDKIMPIKLEGIAFFYIENENVYVYTLDAKKYLVSKNLDALEEQFTPQFFRVNRQFLINRKVVKDASQYFNRKLIVNLTFPFEEQILVGKLKVSSFIDWLTEL
jgi:two-component system, LytTR family, response regulator LytT